MIDEKILKKALAYSLNILGKREYSQYDIQQKISQKYGDDYVDKVIMYLQKHGYQSDARCCESIIRSYAFRNYGLKRIKQELLNRKISLSFLDNLLPTMNIDWVERATEFVIKKYGDVSLYSLEDKRKICALLLRRGYSMNEAISAIKKSLLK
ncbi:MAG: regulatory protein RecX [Succinivibrionaceae bacterium]